MKVWTDRGFWAAMGAGPAFWLAYGWAAGAVAGPAWIAGAPATFIKLALLYPLVEELVFRGLLQGVLFYPRLGHVRRGGITAANLLASVLFVLAHWPHQPPVWALAVFFPSLVFGFFRDRYHRTAPAVALHIWYNLGFFALFAP